MPRDPVTRVAVLTPQGRGAVAVVSIQGPLAETAVNRHFYPANQRPLDGQPLERIVFGRWARTDGEEVVVCRRDLHIVEVHCHGGQAASAAIIQDLEQAGCQTLTWTEIAADSEANPISAAARVALAEARTERTAAILLDQYRGALGTTFTDIERLANSPGQSDRDAALRKIATLLARADVGRHLTTPWRIAIAGPPNVGKSSLINALVGYERAIVFDLPGTTRDVVTALTAFDGWPVELADTAGLRTATDEVESAGVALAEAQLASADLAILVFSLADAWSDADSALVAQYPRALLVHNKLDLAHRDDSRPVGGRTSAIDRSGLKELEQAIVERLVLRPLQPGDAVPFASEHLEHLQALQAQLIHSSPMR